MVFIIHSSAPYPFLLFSNPPSCSFSCFVAFFDRLTASPHLRVFGPPYDGV